MKSNPGTLVSELVVKVNAAIAQLEDEGECQMGLTEKELRAVKALADDYAERVHHLHVGKLFAEMRHDKAHHLGLGDIRLTIGQQDKILCAIRQGRAIA